MNLASGLRHSLALCRTYVPLTTRLQWRYFSSDHRGDDSEDQLETFQGPIPREKLTINYSRSSGPGGQNVNKLNTKAEIRFHLESADWLPERVKRRTLSMFRNRVNKEGELVVVSQVYRTQHQNLDDAVRRLSNLLSQASEIPKGPSELTKARIRELKRKADKKRRIEKKYRSMKKQDRKDF